jgi:hypothetical protein
MAFDFAYQSPQERPRQRPPLPPQKPARVEQVKQQKTLAELQQDVQRVMSEALSAIDVMERSSSFGISIRDYAKNVTKDLRAYDTVLQRSEEDIQRALRTEATLGIRDHRQVNYLLERIRNMRQRIARVAIPEPELQDKNIATSAPSLKELEKMQELMRQPKDTDAPPSPWAAYRQDLVTQRNHLPELPQNPYNTSPAPQRESNAQSPWANWKPEQQPPSTPAQQSPSFFKKSTAAVSRWLKSWF